MVNKSIVALSVFLIISFTLFGWSYGFRYSEGYDFGYHEGHHAGYHEGYGLGFDDGKTEGYGEGYVSGNESGLEEGYVSGHGLGLDEGYVSGNESGLEEGYALGLDEGEILGYDMGFDAGVRVWIYESYTVRNPTYSEVLNFISSDQTNENIYDDDEYVCWNYVADFKNNAFDEGYRCGFVYVEFPDLAHAIVAFDTTDQGLIFVEPQSDEFIELVIGEPFNDRDIYLEPEYDDTVIAIGIVW
jgi:hypothetical protein